jgi:ankyrin repeat protein
VRKPNRGDGEDGNPPPIGSGKLTSLEMARALVKHGADVNARVECEKTARGRLGRSGATPFFMAAITADAPLLRVLLELGADPAIANADGAPPILAASGVGAVAPGEDAGSEPEVLEALDLLIERGADVNAVDANGETAMHGAAYKNHPLVVAHLAEKGARIEVWNKKNKWGWAPLTIAEGYRVGNYKPSPETVAALHRVLLAAGIQPPASSKPEGDGKTY